MSRNLGTLTSWNSMGLFRPVMGQVCLSAIYYTALSVAELRWIKFERK
jgi:hypothetical protein